MISIHAPLTGSDLQRPKRPAKNRHFNPRSPYGERPGINVDFNGNRLFQSTLPLRGATQIVRQQGQQAQFQSTLPLRGATHFKVTCGQSQEISIHAPLTGSDVFSGGCCPATKTISIHAPLTGSDSGSLAYSDEGLVFQSTLPLRGATTKSFAPSSCQTISIHAPLTGSDVVTVDYNCSYSNFNPRSPYGERLERFPGQPKPARFQSTLPLRGATLFT